MSQNKYNSKPPLLNQREIDKFALGAEKDLIDSLQQKEMPWDIARLDVIKLMNVRMPEEYYLKLDYLSKKHRISKNKLCLEAIIAEIDKKLGE